MKIGDLAVREPIGAYDLLELAEILSAFIGRPLVGLLPITGGLTNACAEKHNSKQANTKCRCQKLFQKATAFAVTSHGLLLIPRELASVENFFVVAPDKFDAAVVSIPKAPIVAATIATPTAVKYRRWLTDDRLDLQCG
jgi:hypothetical protein